MLPVNNGVGLFRTWKGCFTLRTRSRLSFGINSEIVCIPAICGRVERCSNNCCDEAKFFGINQSLFIASRLGRRL